MTLMTVSLFVACLVFSGFNFLVNTKSAWWLKFITGILGLAGLFGAGYLLFIAFMSYIK